VIALTVPPPAPRADEMLLKIVGLTKVFKGSGPPVPAVREVSLSVRPGQFVAVMGPSGSGKSSLLHMIGGLEPPTSGQIWFDGVRVDSLSQAKWAMLRRRHIGFVFQFFNLVSNMTVADNVELPALMSGATRRQARERRIELLAELGLSDRAGVSPTRLSGGEQQRVALARALANRPSLLLADEPTGNLDSLNTANMLRLLCRVHGQGQAIILVTHDGRAASMADRVVNLFDGMVVDDVDVVAPIRPSVAAAGVVRLGE
jgi:putative ABC transport system ATP-binding protein